MVFSSNHNRNWLPWSCNRPNPARGLVTIRSSDVRRGDGISEKLAALSSIVVHKECRKEYTRQSSIVSLFRPFSKEAQTPQIIVATI